MPEQTENNTLPTDFYTPLGDAVIELHNRRKSPGLLQKVRQELKLTTDLEVLFERPHLVLFRQVLTPLNETLLFFELAKEHNLNPIVIEYYDDKFVSSGNQFKRGLGKMPIHQFTSPGGRDVFEYKTIVDFNQHVGHPLRSVLTVAGESLISLHHQLFFGAADIKPIIIGRDGSAWFKQFSSSQEYYQHFLKLFLRDAILFETFLTDGAEAALTFNTVLPAQQLCVDTFSFKPLIVQATYEGDTTDHALLNYYPKHVAALLNEKGYI